MTAKAPRFCEEFVPDPDLGLDWKQRATCLNCGRVGQAGDPGHTPPAPPPTPTPKTRISPALAAAAQARDAAILGEHDPEELPWSTA
ncbi:hypothetical protein GA0070622_1220 [Micromonospora sediminicola]|uniref:Uncharacterized protein n=1 Tax=Micromonospora sediminicola TaxID=946078 RepID=A0A1A9B430_9ACTN|nr:hypothetical protein [Micromonospora sediminicola]SBT64250.1 hypothetical protein GA0070622_1220 [Micromonospora sediminicola]